MCFWNLVFQQAINEAFSKRRLNQERSFFGHWRSVPSPKVFNVVSFHKVMHAKTESLHLMWVEGMEQGFGTVTHDWDFVEMVITIV